MKITTQEILAAVIRSLDEDVVPHLERESWVTSSVRSCIQLLTYLQDRIPQEREILMQSNQAMADFLRDTVLLKVERVQPLRDEISAALNASAVADEADLEQLNAANQGLKEVLTALVLRRAEDRSQKEATGDDGFRDKLHACLSSINNLEQDLFTRARLRVPI
jgi:hypothetical protein